MGTVSIASHWLAAFCPVISLSNYDVSLTPHGLGLCLLTSNCRTCDLTVTFDLRPLPTDLLTSDSGQYTCTVTSPTGQTSASARLTVANPKNPNVNFYRLSEPDTYPSAPQRPRVSERNESSVALSWRPGQQMGGSALLGYTVEYYSPDTPAGWVTAVRRVAAETVTVTGLRSDTTYVFGVRAENGQGVSPLSELSVPVHTLAAAADGAEGRRVAEAASRLREFTVELRKATPISSTAVRLSWKVSELRGWKAQ